MSAPGPLHLLLHHATFVAHFGEEAAGEERIHATGAAAGEERLEVIIGVVEFAPEEIGSRFGELPHGGEGIFHGTNFAIGIGLRDDFGDDAIHEVFGSCVFPRFNQNERYKQYRKQQKQQAFDVAPAQRLLQ